jgi:competence protein ComEC
VGTGALVEWIAAGMIAGQLAGGVNPGAVVVAAGLGLAALAGHARLLPAARGHTLGPSAACMAALLGAALVLRATAPPDDPADVATWALPLRARVVGRIAAVPAVDERRTNVVVEVGSVGGRPARGRVRLRIRGHAPLARGDVVGVAVTLRRPRNFANPGRFDLAGMLARRGVHVTASVWDATTIERLGTDPGGPGGRMIDRWRAAVQAVLKRVATPDVAAVLLALVLGDEGGIGPDLRAAFTRAGVVHVLSVSGLHVGIVTTAAAALIAWAWGRSPGLLLRGDRRKVAAAGGLAIAVAYGALTGFEVATMRALVMAGVVVVALQLDRDVAPLRALSLAAVTVALLEPGAPAEISYQLSFVSVAALVAGAAPMRAGVRRPWIARAGRAATACWIATAPLTAFHFHQVSLVSVVVNPLVVPLFEAMSLLPALTAAVLAPVAPEAARLLFELAGLPVRAAIALVVAVGAWDWAAIDVPFPDVRETVLIYVMLVGAWLRRHAAARMAVAAALLLLAVDAAWWAIQRTAGSTARVTFLDVGQGDAAVLELGGGRVIVVDAGGFPGSDFDTGAAIVEPFLRARKIATVDALVMSHAHPDHAAGLAHLVRRFRPEELWWSGTGGIGTAWDAIVRALRETGTPVRILHAGDRIRGYPELDVLHPPAGWPDRSLNEGSLVLRARLGSAIILLTGDAERGAEAAMVAAQAGRLRATVLKAPHHGSRTSSGEAFVAAVAPEIAVVSAGADNRFGHPSAEVSARFGRRGVALYRTDRCGAITVDAAGAVPRVTTAIARCAPGDGVRPPPR